MVAYYVMTSWSRLVPALVVEQDAALGKRIRVACPYCNKVGVIVAEKDVLNDGMLARADSMVKMRVFRGDVCEHEFEVALDWHCKAR